MIVPQPLRERIAPATAQRIAAELAPIEAGMEVAMPPCRLLLLCFTNRCGSNYLGQLLAATGFFNEAGENFNAETVLEHARGLPRPSLRAYLPHLDGLIGRNGWLVVKASVDQLMMLTDAGILDDMHDRTVFLLLERRDRLAQAVSRCIAAQTGRWTTGHAALADATAYSRATIDAELAKVALANQGFYAFFAANRIAPLHLVFEDVVAAPQAALDAVASRCGVAPLRADPTGVRIRRQADAINAAWMARYKAGG